MTYSELKRMLRKAGCRKIREGSRHEVWYSPLTEELFTVGRHDKEDVPTGTYKTIIEAAGIK